MPDEPAAAGGGPGRTRLDTGPGRWSVPWTVLEALAVILVAAVLTVVALLAISLLAAAVDLPPVTNALILPLPLILLGVVTVAWVRMRHPGAVGRLTGPLRGQGREWLIGAGIGLAAFFALNLGAVLLLQLLAAAAGVELPQTQEGIQQAIADPQLLPFVILAAVVVAPVAEELFFRGMLFQALRQRLNRGWGIAVSAILFALAHVLQEPSLDSGLLVFVLILPLGALLAWLFERRGTLVTPIAVHATFNLVTIGLSLVAQAAGGLALLA